jgi:hypothetical protein
MIKIIQIEDIKTIILNFIDQDLIIDSNSSILVSDFIIKLENYFGRRNIRFDKYKVKFYICLILGNRLSIDNYKSSVVKGQRIYKGFKWKEEIINTRINENIDIIYELNIYKNDLIKLTKEFEEFKFNTEIILNNINLSKNKEKIKTKLSIYIIKSLSLEKHKDETYTLLNFIDDFIEYDKNSNYILYLSTVINDYIKYTGSTIHVNTLSKMLNKILLQKFNTIESKWYEDKKYIKGLIYKNN